MITPEGRGPGGWYYAYAGADTFEVWADVARHYRLDGRRASIAGYSMGGYGTWKLAGQYPDLFSRAQPTVGPTVIGPVSRTNTVHQVASLRHIPVLSWLSAGDGSVPLQATLPNTQELERLGYRYELDVFRPFNNLFVPEHFVLAFNDFYQPAADFLGDALVRRNPARVSYAYNPTMDFAAGGTVAGHAYWLSGLRLRSTAGDPPVARIDVRSHGFGTGDPPAGPTQNGTGTLTGGALGPLAYDFERKTWGETPRCSRRGPARHRRRQRGRGDDRPQARAGELSHRAERDQRRPDPRHPRRLPRQRLAPRSVQGQEVEVGERRRRPPAACRYCGPADGEDCCSDMYSSSPARARRPTEERSIGVQPSSSPGAPSACRDQR